jgi:hypothetical protein
VIVALRPPGDHLREEYFSFLKRVRVEKDKVA